MALRCLLRAVATFRKDEQPEWHAHIHPHGHATARVARRFAAGRLKSSGGPTLDEIEVGSHLHDVGKYLTSRAVLLKPGPLSEQERAAISLHPVHGFEMLRGVPHLTTHIIRIVLYHHERWDGGGYPEGLSGHAIPLAARIVSVADVYTSLRSRRSYKPTLTREKACATLASMAGRELDPALVQDFLGFIMRAGASESPPVISARPLDAARGS